MIHVNIERRKNPAEDDIHIRLYHVVPGLREQPICSLYNVCAHRIKRKVAFTSVLVTVVTFKGLGIAAKHEILLDILLQFGDLELDSEVDPTVSDIISPILDTLTVRAMIQVLNIVFADLSDAG
jgi:hypothetical protein